MPKISRRSYSTLPISLCNVRVDEAEGNFGAPAAYHGGLWIRPSHDAIKFAAIPGQLRPDTSTSNFTYGAILS